MEQLYTVEQVAEKLQVQPRTVRDWLKAGKLGGLITGRFWRIRESDLQTFLQKAEIFARLKYFRSQNPGWGYPEIAQQLNREGLCLHLEIRSGGQRHPQTFFQKSGPVDLRLTTHRNKGGNSICGRARTSRAIPGNRADCCARLVRMTRDAYLRTGGILLENSTSYLRTAHPAHAW